MKNNGINKRARLLQKLNHAVMRYIKPWFNFKSFKSGLIVGAFAFCLLELGLCQLVLKYRLHSDEGKIFYTLGQLYARQIGSMRLNPTEVKILAQGLKDWAGDKQERVSYDTYRPQLQRMIESRQADQVLLTKKEGQEYLKKFIRSGGALSLSGLGYRVVVPGSQKKPSLKDWIEVTYQGSLLNGKVIDATPDTQQKAKFPLNGVIPGWTEGLQLIGEGGEIELVIPSELAYGEQRTITEIPPGSTLIFRIRLHKVLDSGRIEHS